MWPGARTEGGRTGCWIGGRRLGGGQRAGRFRGGKTVWRPSQPGSGGIGRNWRRTGTSGRRRRKPSQKGGVTRPLASRRVADGVMMCGLGGVGSCSLLPCSLSWGVTGRKAQSQSQSPWGPSCKGVAAAEGTSPQGSRARVRRAGNADGRAPRRPGLRCSVVYKWPSVKMVLEPSLVAIFMIP